MMRGLSLNNVSENVYVYIYKYMFEKVINEVVSIVATKKSSETSTTNKAASNKTFSIVNTCFHFFCNLNKNIFNIL